MIYGTCEQQQHVDEELYAIIDMKWKNFCQNLQPKKTFSFIFLDSLEVGNNRKALQETEKLLKKHPNMWCARALKALALLRLGRYEESQIVLKTVSNEKPVDDPTLQVLSFCYKELEQRK